MMMKIKPGIQLTFFLLVFSVFLLTTSCKETSTPRPYGYFRVDLPGHQYSGKALYGYPFSFEISEEARIVARNEPGEKYWLDIRYSTLNATIYCSYKPVHSDLFNLVEDTRNIVYKHLVKADDIAEISFENPDKKVYGILYELSGNTASPVQFILTDSINHFFRGALYFESVPNKDSIAPIAQYVQRDIVKLMESFEWKKTD
jgi:gliding motility-associated lipoprotein GldD